MPFTHLFLRDIGPFKDLHLDLTDGKGNPHLGPHILAGVNGSGKSTLLRALALTACRGHGTENLNDFSKYLAWSQESLILTESLSPVGEPSLIAAAKRVSGRAPGWEFPSSWMPQLHVESLGQLPKPAPFFPPLVGEMHLAHPQSHTDRVTELVAAYRPALALRSLPEIAPAPGDQRELSGLGALGFESTVDNGRVQHWLTSQFSKRAIAKQRGTEPDRFERTLQQVDNLLSSVFGQSVHLDVDIESPVMQPLFQFAGRSLGFSQLPDGVRYLLGVVTDFLRRQDLANWDESVKDRKPSVLLIDEIDGHLHPKWQRQVLPALRAAFPDVQIIVSTHSPFVISSCDGAVVHVLELSEDGIATARPPMQAPVGMSIEATIKDVFGVESRFGVQTERDLAKWNALQKRAEAGALSANESAELKQLSDDLASRGEELRLIVESAGTLSKQALKALIGF